MALDKIGIKTVKRLGFKTVAFLPLGMSHAEMCDLVFGSFLLPASDLQDIANEPEDALGRHLAMSEKIVNHLMNHQGVRHACWKGLALARFQVGLAVLLLNTPKWYKIRHGQLRPMALRSVA